MNAKTLEAITRHGNSLLAAFPQAIERDPLALCKKLRRIETATHRVMTDYCNGDATSEQCDAACDKAKERLARILGLVGQDVEHLYINRDPRGYALKLDDEWTRQWNDAMRQAGRTTIYTDMGGYGILAPDLNN